MSLKSLLDAGIKTIFGGTSPTTPQPTAPAGNLVRAEDIKTIIETIKKMKDMNQASMSVHAACLELRSQVGSNIPELDALDHVAIKSSEESVNALLTNVDMIQQWENVKVSDASAAKINVTVFSTLGATIMKNYSDTLVKCSQSFKALEALDKIAPIDRKEEISSKLKASLEESVDWSLKLHNVVFRSCNYAESVDVPQRQPG